MHTPGEFEDYYDEYEQIVESEMDEGERPRSRVELGERYGVSWHDARIPETMARFRIGP
jgi:DNA-binding FadR family transcriptional regulator